MGEVGRGNPEATADDPLHSRRATLASLPIIALIVLAGNLLGTALALLWIGVSRTPWRAVGFTSPARWVPSLVLAIVGGVLLKLVVKALILPLLSADPMNAAYHSLAGNPAALPGVLFTVIVGAGFGEELIWRGLLFERLERLFGEAPWARILIVAATTALFAAAHLPDQGLAGAEQAVITGAVFGTAYMLTRSIWPVMAAHAAFDLTAVALIYTGSEAAVAGWLFG